MIDKENTSFVYTFSSRGNMPRNIVRSIRTLKDFVDEDQIHVFYTPPFDSHDENEVEKLGVNLHKKDNRTEGFRTKGTQDKRNYGEKLNICEMETENVVFLDCDTLILGDIWEVMEGDFDFKARFDEEGTDEEKWQDLFDERGRKQLEYMINAGFMIFKNGIHRKIKDEWESLMDDDFDYRKNGRYLKEQIALSLVISEFETENMTSEEHVFEWKDNTTADGTVYHLTFEESDKYPIDYTIEIIDGKLPFFSFSENRLVRKIRDKIVK